MAIDREQRLFDALKRISRYQSPDKLRKTHWTQWGLDNAEEAIEMAYENVIEEAKSAIRGMRRPKALKTDLPEGS